jgi:hypothetical protein
MKLKRFENFIQESMSDSPEKEWVDVDNEYSKLKKSDAYGVIDLGKVSQVSDTDIHNLQMKHKDAVIFYKKGRVLMKLKNKDEEDKEIQ